jgi:hypothetical protein
MLVGWVQSEKGWIQFEDKAGGIRAGETNRPGNSNRDHCGRGGDDQLDSSKVCGDSGGGTMIASIFPFF